MRTGYPLLHATFYSDPCTGEAKGLLGAWQVTHQNIPPNDVNCRSRNARLRNRRRAHLLRASWLRSVAQAQDTRYKREPPLALLRPPPPRWKSVQCRTMFNVQCTRHMHCAVRPDAATARKEAIGASGPGWLRGAASRSCSLIMAPTLVEHQVHVHVCIS